MSECKPTAKLAKGIKDIERVNALINIIKRDIQIPLQTNINQIKTEINKKEKDTTKTENNLSEMKNELELTQKSFFENFQKTQKLQYEIKRINVENKHNLEEVNKTRKENKRIQDKINSLQQENRFLTYEYCKEKNALKAMKEKVNKIKIEIENLKNENKNLKSLIILNDKKINKFQSKEHLMIDREYNGVEDTLNTIITRFKVNKKETFNKGKNTNRSMSHTTKANTLSYSTTSRFSNKETKLMI